MGAGVAKFPDMVVVIPGLIGSVLSKDGKALWGTSPGALWQVIAGGALDQLELGGSDNEEDGLGDGIVATALIENVEIVPGLWKQGGYSRLAEYLVQGLHLTRGENYFEFPYDWRRSNKVSAKKLAALISPWLAAWRTNSGNPDAKVVFVVHSMGGLVARYFVECLEGWKVTKTILSFGTPYKGSGNALGFLCNGFAWKIGPIQAFNGTDAIRSFDSVYQLLPTYPFVSDLTGGLKRTFEIDLPNLDRSRAQAAHAFHEQIRTSQAGNALLEDYARSGPKVRPVVGTEQPTIQSATWDGRALSLLTSREGSDQAGDGTVPRVSAFPFELAQSSATYVPNTHSALQSDDAAVGHMRGVLTEADIDTSTYRAAAGASFALHLNDAYLSTEPVRIEVATSDYVQKVDGVIERLDEPSEPLATTLRPETNGRYGTDERLEPGTYRVKLSAGGFHPVEDVFLVAAE
jgi:pimeloyl-ACP methyl ester carboxylesterase